MKKSNLEILGLSEGATEEQIKDAYSRLRAKYLEDRFKDGEEGNEAARMLTKLDTAYNELMSELAEDQSAASGGTSFERVEELIRSGDVQEAQRVLDGFNERNARWHYLQSVVFYKKSWMNESKKQLEIAMQLEPDNENIRRPTASCATGSTAPRSRLRDSQAAATAAFTRGRTCSRLTTTRWAEISARRAFSAAPSTSASTCCATAAAGKALRAARDAR